MCNGLEFQQWQASAIRSLLVDPAFEAALIINDCTARPKPSFGSKLSRNLLYNQYETRILRPSSRQKISLKNELASVSVVNCAIQQRGKFSEYFQTEQIEFIKNQQLDFIIRFGFGIIRGEILNVARWGVWSYHHGDPEFYRGGPPGLWELLHKKPITGAILQRLTDKLDQGIILETGFFPTVKHSYSEQIDTFLNGSALWIRKAAHACRNGSLDPNKGLDHPTHGNLFLRPSNLTFLAFLFRLTKNRLRFYYQKYFQREMWSVAIAKASPNQLLENKEYPDFAWFPEANSSSVYFADPFVLNTEAGLEVFLEVFDYKSGKATINKASLGSDFSFKGSEVVLDDTHHYSYPFVFQHNSDSYLIPECWQSGGIQLFKIEDSKATLISTIVPEIKGVDPTLIHDQGKFWLFFTTKDAPSHQLYLYYADSVEGPYHPHLLNPVKTDISNSRPGGTPFQYNGSWYRPAQNCSLTYGGSLMLNRIEKLSETEYSEQFVTELKPKSIWRYNKGLHTLSVSGPYLVIDAKRYKFKFGR